MMFCSSGKNCQSPSRVLVLYTGGTIGMVRKQDNVLTPCKGFLRDFIKKHPQTHDSNYQLPPDFSEELLVLPFISNLRRVSFNIIEFDDLMDSSNMDMFDWLKIATQIKEFYKLYDGFVVLHGTDTLAYTSSALSFMLENLGKPVVITGSQVPILEPVTDAIDNFVCSVAIAGNFSIPEVTVYFNHELFRGNRVTKISTEDFFGFQTNNYPALAKVGTSFMVNYNYVLTPNAIAEFHVVPHVTNEVSLIKMYPGMRADAIKPLLQASFRGVVLQSYGAGNIAVKGGASIISHLKAAVEQGIIIVNVTQCASGKVSNNYEAGKVLDDLGILSGGDMTLEAAFTKLCYVLSKEEWSLEDKKKKMVQPLRGEVSLVKKLPLDEFDFIVDISQKMKLTSPEQKQHLNSILTPPFVIAAVTDGDLSKLSELKIWGIDFNLCNADGRTPLHVACSNGNVEVVEFLLSNDANVHMRDRYGNVPLLDAVNHAPVEVIQLLIAQGAHLDVDSWVLGDEMCRAAARGQVARLKRLSLAGASLMLTDLDGRTPLHMACLHQQLDVTRFLLDKGASIDIPDILGNIPIDYAHLTGNTAIISALQGIPCSDDRLN